MPRSYRYLHYDVFTDHLFGGNQLAVVLDARGLSTATMQAIAKEMNFSETTFVLPPERQDTDVRMRIFTPGDELPMAGHPTIGSTFALARTGVIEPGRDRFVFGLGVGPVPVTLTWTKDELSFVWMTQGLPQFGEPVADRDAAASAISLPSSVLGESLPVQSVSCGVPFVFIPLATRGDVDRAAVNRPALDALLTTAGPTRMPGPASRSSEAAKADPHGVFLFSAEPGPDGATAYSRMFAPALGVAEDPATGIASGPLGCYLVRHGLVAAEKAARMLSLQGAKMGRPSHVHISITRRNGDITEVRVGGESVLAGEGTLYI
jgi:trans-2,3-dihydro-3-hydroxyanthranilate isomerase